MNGLISRVIPAASRLHESCYGSVTLLFNTSQTSMTGKVMKALRRLYGGKAGSEEQSGQAAYIQFERLFIQGCKSNANVAQGDLCSLSSYILDLCISGSYGPIGDTWCSEDGRDAYSRLG